MSLRPLLLGFGIALLAITTARGDVITDWNQTLINTIRTDPSRPGGPYSTRTFAMLHGAMYDAVQAIDRTHKPFHVSMFAAPDTSKTAAAVQAAYRVLLDVYPGQQTALNTALANSLAAVPDGPGKTAGITLGDTIGANYVSWRATDGAHTAVPYTPGTAAGQWRPTWPNFQAAVLPGWGQVTPFFIPTVTTYQLPTPPPMDSPEYAAQLNEVKELGALNSATRTPDQTQIGIFWSYDRRTIGPPAIQFNQIAQQVASDQGNTLEENARMFALMNIAQADSGIAGWYNKYLHNFWRPVTAIREANSAGNALVVEDPNWTPLGGSGGAEPYFTPGHPDYPSGHALFGGAAFESLKNFFGTDDISFTALSDELPGVERSFTNFSQAQTENMLGRIYLGVHTRMAVEGGDMIGRSIADYLFANFMTPVPEPSGMSLAFLAVCIIGLRQSRRMSTFCPNRLA